jgi:hypothetical protein
LFDLLIGLTFVHCAFSVDTPSNPRVSFLFHIALLCCVTGRFDSSTVLALSSQVSGFKYLKSISSRWRVVMLRQDKMGTRQHHLRLKPHDLRIGSVEYDLSCL